MDLQKIAPLALEQSRPVSANELWSGRRVEPASIRATAGEGAAK